MTGVEAQPWVPALTFAAKLAIVRNEMGWNIKEAARACGIKPQSWRGWEIERRVPHDQLAVAKKIADATGVDLQWLLFGDQLAPDDGRPGRVLRRGRRLTASYPAGVTGANPDRPAGHVVRTGRRQRPSPDRPPDRRDREVADRPVRLTRPGGPKPTPRAARDDEL